VNLEKCLVDNPPHGWDAIVEGQGVEGCTL
jgi:hypothetical protein